MTGNKVLIELSESEKTAFRKQSFETQSVPQRVFSSIWAIESEVNNGGFCQYFQNSSAETASFVVQALEMVGASDTADICRRAISVAYPAGLPATAAAISAGVGELPAGTLERFDEDFLAYPNDLTELLFAYVSEHSESFGTMPKDDD